MMISILMILDDFAPHNNCAAIPNTKLVKYLARENVKITLITKEITPSMNLDHSLLPREMEHIRCIHVGHSALFSKTLGASRERITQSGLKLKMKSETRPLRSHVVSGLKNTFFEIRRHDWLTSAKKAVKETLSHEHFDFVYSSYPDLDAHWLASYVIKKGIADKWIADFRDPMFYEHHDSHGLKRKQRRQYRIERKTDHITIVSEGALDKFQCSGVPKEKITCIPNGYDPDDFTPKKNSSNLDKAAFRIFYAGTLYAGKRDLSVLFQLLSELSAEQKVDCDHIRIEYAGNEWPIMYSFAERYGLENCCINHGYIPRHQVMTLMDEVDCSIVCTHNTKNDQGVVTGKIFELLLVEKPIIAIVNGDVPNSELGGIVRQCNAGVVYEQAVHSQDYPEFKRWIEEKYREKMQNGHLVSSLATCERERYSYAHIAHELYTVMRSVMLQDGEQV